jgi:hypothetical protein
MTDAAATQAADARMARIEESLARLTNLITPRPVSPVRSLAESAPDSGPGLFTYSNSTGVASGVKLVLRPNPPFVFDGDRTRGRVFIHSVRSYARLVPEAFVESGELSEEKVVQYAMSFMAKDSAQRWAERQSAKPVFPFPTFEAFLTEFQLRFIEENEQDHALIKLESRSYHMGSRDIFLYTDDFEDLVDLAGFEDPLVKVTKYRTGLDLAINLAITGSSDPPDLRDYAAWQLRAYQQYESLLHARNAGGTGCHPVAPGRTRTIPITPSMVATPQPKVAAPVPPAPISMDVDRTRARNLPHRGCFRCGDPNHFA